MTELPVDEQARIAELEADVEVLKALLHGVIRALPFGPEYTTPVMEAVRNINGRSSDEMTAALRRFGTPAFRLRAPASRP